MIAYLLSFVAIAMAMRGHLPVPLWAALLLFLAGSVIVAYQFIHECLRYIAQLDDAITPDTDATGKVLEEIKAERERQDARWGVQNHSPMEWQGILIEEVGEAAKEATDYHFRIGHRGDDALDEKIIRKQLQAYRAELIQVAAVAVAMVECLDRNEKS